jgi:hypothetical protein
MHPLIVSAVAAERRRDQMIQATAARRARQARRARRAARQSDGRGASGCQSGWVPPVSSVPWGDATLSAR